MLLTSWYRVTPLTWECYGLLQGKIKKSLLHMPFLTFFQLEIFNMPRGHILRQHILNPINTITGLCDKSMPSFVRNCHTVCYDLNICDL